MEENEIAIENNADLELDNRLNANEKKRGRKSKFRGITTNDGKWYAFLHINGK